MTGQIEQLESASIAARTKKGRMDADSRRRAASLVAAIWADPGENPELTLPYLADLKAEALADGMGRCWAAMPRERRELFNRWLPAPVAERDVRRVAFMLGSIVESDPVWAMAWLQRLAPAERKTVSKDTRQHLASSLFTETHQKPLYAAIGTQPPREAVRLYTLLWDIAIDPALSVSKVARARLGGAILDFRPPATSDSISELLSNLVSRVRLEASTWPFVLRQEFETRLGFADLAAASPGATADSGEALVTPAIGDPVGTGEPMTHTPVAPWTHPAKPPATSRDTSTDKSAEPPQVDRELTAGAFRETLNAAAAGVQTLLPLLNELLSSLASKQRDQDRVAAELTKAHRAYSELRLHSQALESARDAALAELSAQREERLALTQEFETLRGEADLERRRLSQQIAANASGRIDEYKTKLALALSRLIVDLPDKHAPVSEALGRVVLLQFHQFLEALRQEGIDVNRGAHRP